MQCFVVVSNHSTLQPGGGGLRFSRGPPSSVCNRPIGRAQRGQERKRKKNPESPKLRRPHRAAAAAAAIGQVGLQRPRRARRERALIQPLGPARGLCTIFWCLYVSFILLVVGRGYILCTLEAFQSTSASNIFGTPGWWCWSGLVGSPHKCPQIKHRRDCGEPQCCQV